MIQDFQNKKILLGVTGGIAAYKSAHLVRQLTQLGASVQVIMTQGAQQFVTPLTFQALSGHPVRTDVFDVQAEQAMGHIELAKWADYLVVAPATAHCMAQFAHGLADDLLSTVHLATKAPILICPAMNQAMWHHPATQANRKILADRGVCFVGPEAGEQACGDVGYGRLSETDSIVNALRLLDCRGVLAGRRCVITAGPTQESIDPVRYLSNHSSGKMGYAMAEAAVMAGAAVTLVSGPTVLQVPTGVNVIATQSAKEMHDAVHSSLQPGDIFISVAAVSDYAVPQAATQKLKKQSSLTLTLEQTVDIVKSVVASELPSYVVGFAAETEQTLTHAQAKLDAKQLDMIAANTVGAGLGFEADDNQVTLITKQRQINLPRQHKTRLAGHIISHIAEDYSRRGVKTRKEQHETIHST